MSTTLTVEPATSVSFKTSGGFMPPGFTVQERRRPNFLSIVDINKIARNSPEQKGIPQLYPKHPPAILVLSKSILEVHIYVIDL